MSRFNRYEEDIHRLPSGWKRISYDADTRVYTFRDEKGALYQSAPGEEYGILTPISRNPPGTTSTRPGAFDESNSDNITPKRTGGRRGTTFQEMLPPAAIASSPSPVHSLSRSFSLGKRGTPATSDRSPHRTLFVEAVKKSTLPKVHVVVQNLRRSVTSARKPPSSTARGQPPANESEDTAALLRRSSRASSNITRSTSLSSTRSGTSTIRPNSPRRL
ncbi:hypothetical protein BDN72DRAFT_954890 [Pluteus cervinus]|uniref:Uncharacterized protein n=1 Tax=Pluteus cervinus TaxID=181527 RepID=A0ACD3BC56_9AGAR|nr:hypothetical protein BDN72DRAFT_954890 [Pluteus cervinus]